jgi:hypothetical protein
MLMSEPIIASSRKNWRDVYGVHPAANAFPLMNESELKELAGDIKKNGLRQKVVILDGEVLDGRNRLEALQMLGWLEESDHGQFIEGYLTDDAYGDGKYKPHAG